MPRAVYPYEPTWLDRKFRKALKKLSASDHDDVVDTLASFIDDLRACTHPAMDPAMHTWGPKGYPGVLNTQLGNLIEYAGFPDLMRVVVLHVTDADHECYDDVLLLTVTLVHDHDRMKRLIQSHRGNITRWEPVPDA